MPNRRFSFVLGTLGQQDVHVVHPITIELTKKRENSADKLWRAHWEESSLDGHGSSLQEAVETLSHKIATSFREKSKNPLLSAHLHWAKPS
jgi:hypothetical protein